MDIRQFLPKWLTEVPEIADLATALDGVWKPEVSEPAALLLDVRDLAPTSERELLRRSAFMLGYTGRHQLFDNPRLHRLITHMPKFRSQHGTELYKSFLAFLLNHPIEVDNCWTDDYVGFFAVPNGPKLIDGLGQRRADNEGWYPTTHVILRCRPKSIFPNSTEPYKDTLELFYKIAPAYVVVEHLGAVTDMLDSRLQLNIGVIEGYSERTIVQDIEVPGKTGDWQSIRSLPYRVQGHRAETVFGKTIITGGYTGQYRNEKTVVGLEMSGLKWLDVDAGARTGSDIVCGTYSGSQIGLATSTGDVLVSVDGTSWTKVWTPLVDAAEAAVALLYNQQSSVWALCGQNGSLVLSIDGKDWSSQPIATTSLKSATVGAGVYVLFPKDSGKILYSLDGVSWSGTQVADTILVGGAYHSDLDQWIVIGQCGTAWISQNLVDWTPVNIGIGDFEVKTVAFCACSSAVIVYGDNAVFGYSYDLMQWFTPDTLFRTQGILAAAYIQWTDQFFLFGDNVFVRGKDTIWNRYKYPLQSNRKQLVRTPSQRTVAPPRANLSNLTDVEAIFQILFNEGYVNADGTGYLGLDVRQAIRDSLRRGVDVRTTIKPVREVSWQVEDTVIVTEVPIVPYPLGVMSIPSLRKIVVYGRQGFVNVASVEAKIVKKADMANRRAYHTSFVYDNAIYVAGGKSNGASLVSVEKYDVEDNVWTAAASLPSAVHDCASAVTVPRNDNWAIRYTGFGENNIHSCAYDSTGKYYIGGTNGMLAESEHGIHWETLDSPFPSKTVTGFTANSSTNVYHLYGYQTKTNVAQILFSNDNGKTWIPQDTSWWTGPINVAKYFERTPLQLLIGGIHAPGENGLPNVPTVIGATGLTWAVDDVTSTLRLGSKSVYGGIYCETYGRYVMCVDGGIVWSTDKKNWVYSSFRNSRNEIDNRIPCLSVTDVAGTLVALSANGDTHFSTDAGHSWYQYYTGTALATGLSGDVDWNQTEWIEAGYYRPRYAHLVTTNWNNRVWASVPSGMVYYSDTRGFNWSVGGYAGGSDPPYARKLAVAQDIERIMRAMDTTVEICDGTGVFPSWTSVTLTNGIISEEQATAVCYVGNYQWLVGGNRLWLVSNPLFEPVMVDSFVEEIPIRFAPGPNMSATYVSGKLERQTAQYQITCIDEQGESRPSDICVIEIPASTEGIGISLSWNRVPGARGYRLYGRKQGSMYMLAQLSGDAINFVDDGTTPLQLDIQLPIADTSGLMGQTAKRIVDIVWSAKTNTIHLVTDTGYVARSTDRVNWYGILNPAILADQTRNILLTKSPLLTTTGPQKEIAGSLPVSDTNLLQPPSAGDTTLPIFIGAPEYVYPGGLANVWQIVMAEPSATYVVAGNNGAIGISTDGINYNVTTQTTGDYTCAAFDADRNIIGVGSSSGILTYSRGKTAAITPQISGYTVEVAPAPTTLTTGFYQYMVAAYRDSVDGTLSVATDAIEINFSNRYITITVPVDDTIEGYKIYRVRSLSNDMSSPDSPVYLGILLANSGQKTLSFEDYGSTSVSSQRFFGTGLDDIIWTLTPADVRLIQKFEVVVSDVGTPDKVRYRVNGGAWSEEYDAGPVTMVNNISFNFGATTGHTLRDRWSITVRPSNTIVPVPPFVNNTLQNITDSWVSVNTGKNLSDITVYPSDKNLFIGVGPQGVIHSHNLEVWEPLQQGITNLFSVTSGVVGTNRLLILGGDKVVYSASTVLTPAVRTDIPVDGPVKGLLFDTRSKQFIGVSVDSQIVTSTNGVSWTRRNVNNPRGDLEFIEQGIGNQSLVTGGTVGTVFSSFDGRAWATVDADITNGTINCIIVDDQNTGTMLLAGDGGTIMRSTDNGVTWTQVLPYYSTDDQDTFGGCQTTNNNMVLYGHSVVVSTNKGATFAPPTELPELVGTPVVGIAVNRSTGTTMIITTGSRTYLSYDGGQDWSPTPSFPDLVQASCIAFGQDTWFVAGYDGRIGYSTNDGATWTSFDVNGVPYLDRLYVAGSRQRIDFIGCCYEDNAFIVVATQGDCFRIDTTTFTPVPMLSRFYGNKPNGLFCGNNAVVCYGNRGVLSTHFFGYDRQILVIGGLSNNTPVDTVYNYDPDTDNWTTVTPLPAPRYGASAATCRDGTTMVIAGSDSNGIPQNTVVRWLPHLATWTSGPVLPYYKGWTTAHRVENCRLVVNGGGIDPAHRTIVLSELEAPISKKWLTRGIGTLAAGTYGYRVSAIVGGTETLPTPVQSITVSANSGVLVDWHPVPGSTEYRVYGRDSNASQVLAIVYPPVSQYLDTGASINLIGQSKTVVGEPVWQDLREPMPLPREHFASARTSYGLLVCGGGSDDRCWVLNLNEKNIVRSAWDVRQDQIYVEDYVEDGYVE